VNKTHRTARIALAFASAAAAPAAMPQSVAITGKYPGKVHLLPATLETTQWGWFDNAQPPMLKIDSGDAVVFETMMHSHNQITPGRTIEEIKKLRTDDPGRGPHMLTGPVYVNGAEPGDVLKVSLLKIVPLAAASRVFPPRKRLE
jgi:Acetamidase/Formamidase family